jgi:hypothetical protein
MTKMKTKTNKAKQSTKVADHISRGKAIAGLSKKDLEAVSGGACSGPHCDPWMP